ncbi:hypothetical protein JTE90_009981 [Oedothorax gibbosus]|uniref:BTB domain-containing protein n=1 Tax=Oedothorax gibbosus TaxID=931172 RepID=A0AAV6UFK8_9ARAC|nr:hypothetical protein JTE90_009981 [Oedothorax gibbosus]
MAFAAPKKTIKKAPVYYLIIDYRNEKLHSYYYKGLDGNVGLQKNSSRVKRVVLFRAKLLPRSCFPRVKDSEGGFAWRRKSSRSRNRTPPSSQRPTLLLPPMRCTTPAASTPEQLNSAPVVTTHVQRANALSADSFFSLGNSSHLPQPSAPSPGHLFYNSEDHSDITFMVGQEEWRFPSHSFILDKIPALLPTLLDSALGTPQSEEVRSRLSNMEASAGETVTPIILKLPNLQPEVFEQMYRYIYTGQVTFLTVESTLKLLRPSQVYHLPQLTSHCLSHISKNVTPSNVLLVLSHLLFPEARPDLQQTSLEEDTCCHDNENEQNELVVKCFLIVDRHADEILQSELFETLEHTLMVEIIKRDTLQVSSEAVVFDSVMRWACRACKKQRKELTSDNKCSVLEKALFLVRYLTMTPEEFLRGPVSHGVLTKEDKDIFLTRLTSPSSPSPLPERWSGWKISEKRKRQVALVSTVSSELSDADLGLSPSNSIQPVNTGKRNDGKKKSMSKKLLNGVGDLVICVIQLLD